MVESKLGVGDASLTGLNKIRLWLVVDIIWSVTVMPVLVGEIAVVQNRTKILRKD